MTPEFVYNRLPNDVHVSSPNFVKFMQDYQRYNLDSGVNFVLNNYKDLLYQLAYNKSYEERILKSFGIDVDIVETSNIHGELLYKLMTEFLETRGTKTSFEILFRIMFNKQVEIEYIKDKLFIPSSGTYQQTKLILITGTYPIDFNTSIRGLRSDNTVNIEEFTPYYINGSRYYIIKCNNIKESFINGEPLEVISNYGKVTEVHVPLLKFNIDNGGSLYKKGDVIKINNGKRDYFIINSVEKGTISSIDIVNGGINYKIGDRIKTIDQSHFDARIKNVNINGSVTEIEIKNPGYVFTEIPEIQIISKSGNGLRIKLISDSIGKVKSIIPGKGSFIYDLNDTYTVESEFGLNLELSYQKVDGYIISEYISDNHYLGNSCLIIDSNNKHSFSYNIISDIPGIKYKNAIDKYVNPTGYIYNKVYTKNNETEISNIGAIGEIIRI
jgi:hypothetical protein